MRSTVSLVPRLTRRASVWSPLRRCLSTTAQGASATAPPVPKKGNVFSRWWSNEWITQEAEEIVARAYQQHRPLLDYSKELPPNVTQEELEQLTKDQDASFPVKSLHQAVARFMVNMLVPFTHLFFGERYNHHACVLETVAAIPGMVAGGFRHLKSLRSMNRDHGWIGLLWEEAENERMHLLTWMQVTQPTRAEKLVVFMAQMFYFVAYTGMYAFSPRTAHSFVGYLEEQAVRAYTDYLRALDKGQLPNIPAPEIARKYWQLPEGAKIRDVVLRVRADEFMHRNVNHFLSEMHAQGKADCEPHYPPRF